MARTRCVWSTSQIVRWVIIGIICSISAAHGSTSNNVNTCTTPGCLREAERITSSMNLSFNPCEKFYEFACNGYIQKAKVPEGYNIITRLTERYLNLLPLLKSSIERKMEDHEPRTFKVLQSYYNSCIDGVGEVTESGKRQILEILDDLGGWPLLVGETWNTTNFNLDNLIYKIRKMGFMRASKSFADFTVNLIWEDFRLINLKGALTGIDGKLLLARSRNIEAIKKVEKYKEKMVRYAKLLGADPATAERDLTASLQFEKQLALISDNPLQYSIPFSMLVSNYSEFPWSKYLEEYLPLENGTNVNGNDSIINYYNIHTRFVEKWASLVYNTPKEVLANYAIWRVVEELIDMNEAPLGPWQTCTTFVEQSLPVATGALYIRNHFNKTVRTDIENLMENLRGTYKRVVSKAEWLKEETKNRTIQKVDLMRINAAYPDEYFDDQKLDSYHESLPPATDKFYQSMLNLKKFQLSNEIKKAKGIDNWANQLPTVEPYAGYLPNKNLILLTAGMIQEEYANDRPNYLNYGVMGASISHEITHGFDEYGKNYNGTGRSWNWLEGDSDAQYTYDELIICIISQYDGFKYYVSNKPVKLDSEKTFKEDMADIGGFQVAYQSYEEWIKKNGEELSLPGLESYTPRQLFWIGAATKFCAKAEESGIDELLADVHSPGYFRVIGSFSNMPEFAKDFQCKLESSMNPEDKCKFW